MTLHGFPHFRRPVAALAGLLALASLASPAAAQVAAKAAATAPVALSTALVNASPQEGPIRGPMLGYVFDPSVPGLRPMPGIPGASHVGNPLPLGFAPEFVEVSPSHEYAIGVEAGTGEVFWIDLRTGIPVPDRLAGATAGADRIVYSPLGKAAALYYRQAKQIEVVTGLPGEADLSGRVDLTSLPGLLTALAVSDDGKTVAAATSQGDGGSLFAAAPGEAVRLLGPLGRASGLKFLYDSQDLLVADAGRNEILRIRSAKTAAEWTVLASRRDGIDQPVAVAAARDNATAFAVNSGDRTIARMLLGGGPIEFSECACIPTGLDTLAAGSVFRLTSATSGPLYMLDARPQGDGLSSQPRVLFIPAGDGAPATAHGGSAAPRGRVRH